ncbi:MULTISPECIES: hypothetical protein [unclassified Rathayibacter]|uniref:hypothetical protein n=1 Tax=unclassified Rathayibacter TaxID=2609250 RepID=UPI00105CE55D|nr:MULTISPECIES: hypothetical protein [unclassified Rathayibacter]
MTQIDGQVNLTEADAKLLLAYFNSESNEASARTSSLDTRSTAMITANLALVTIYFAARTQLGISIDTIFAGVASMLNVLVIASTALVLISLFSSVVALFPRRPRILSNYSEMVFDLQTVDRRAQMSDNEVETTLVLMRGRQLDRVLQINRQKSIAMLVCVTATALAIGLFAVTLAVSAFAQHS